MFEQSLLAPHGAAQKMGALFASLTAQILAGGVLVSIPLAYNEVLPVLRLSYPLPMPAMPAMPLPPAPDVNVTKRAPATEGPSFRYPNVFHLPAVGPRPAQTSGPVILDHDIGVPFGGTGVPAIEVQSELPPIDFAPSERLHQPTFVAAPPQGPISVSSGVQAAKIVHKVVPLYPPLARQARVQGTVHLVGVIAKNGTVQQLRVESGHPLLVPYSVNAVKQWIYQPTLLNGQPVEVIAPIDVIFTLQ